MSTVKATIDCFIFQNYSKPTSSFQFIFNKKFKTVKSINFEQNWLGLERSQTPSKNPRMETVHLYAVLSTRKIITDLYVKQYSLW